MTKTTKRIIKLADELVFISTHYGSRGLSTNIEHKSFDDVIKNWKAGKGGGINRYAKPGGGFNMINRMPLEVFEEYILPHGLPEKVIDTYFSNEIAMKYGAKGKRMKAKLIPKKELKPGVTYKMRNGDSMLYLGQVTIDGKFEGYGYIPSYYIKEDFEKTFCRKRKINGLETISCALIRDYKNRKQEIEVDTNYKKIKIPISYEVQETNYDYHTKSIKNGSRIEIIFNDLI